jgi:hypothetical protein
MKLPKFVRIAGRVYDVVQKDTVIVGNRACYGAIRPDFSRIEINPVTEDHQGQCITLWHEILHGLLWTYGVTDLDDALEERIVGALSRGVYQVLQDNARKFFDIVPVKAAPEAAERSEAACTAPAEEKEEDSDDTQEGK